MQEKEMVRISKKMSKHLRHSPESIGLHLDPAGWVAVNDLLTALRLTRAQPVERGERSDKRRCERDGDRIRASQGHGVAVNLALPATEPPAVLYHGTVGMAL